VYPKCSGKTNQETPYKSTGMNWHRSHEKMDGASVEEKKEC